MCGSCGYGEIICSSEQELFEVMRRYRAHENLVEMIERIYDGSMVKFGRENMTTGWCKSDSGVMQCCPLSPLPFSIYVRDLKGISNCVHGVKYVMVSWNGRAKQGFYTQMMCVSWRVVKKTRK